MSPRHAELVLHAGARLGESPVWDTERGCLWWVDIFDDSLHALDAASGVDRRWTVAPMASAVALTRTSALALTCRAGFIRFDPDTGASESLGTPLGHALANRFNDGKCDAAGRFWAGTMALDVAPGAGRLYCLDADGSITAHLADVTISNGPAWSPSSDVMYHTDTITGVINAYEYELGSGRLGAAGAAVVFPASMGVPDGMTVDAEGMLWVALWGGYAIVRCDPRTGRVIDRVAVPAAHVTSCTFAGPRYDRLYITTATDGLDAVHRRSQPLAGGLFAVDVDVPGFAPESFAG